jgi:hypothetical protein
MTQKERDRLAALNEAKRGLITQRQAGGRLGKASGMYAGCY